MAKVILNKPSIKSWVLEDKGHYILGEKGVLDIDAKDVEGNGHGIFTGGGSGGPDGSIIDVLGRITVSLSNYVGIFAQDDDITVRVAESGRVRADTGILINAIGSRIENHGNIRGTDEGVQYYKGLADLMNAEDGVIRGQIGVKLDGEGGTIVNRGKIIGESHSVYDYSDERLELTNAGHLGGDVMLAGGNDLFVNRGGTLDGVVKGGKGDDVFRILSGDIVVSELAGEGQDLLQTKVSYNLAGGASIEIFAALGKANINLTGSDEKNQVIGNNGRNILSGLGGDDLISGRGGNDRLSGGDGIDTFNFVNGHGRDVITDFEQSIDRINFEHYDGVTSTEDLVMLQKGDNVLIKLLNGDQIVLLDQDGVNTDDFLFAVV